MNIFYLDPDPRQAAEWHVDKHVVKMPLEYAQLLSTAHYVLDKVKKGYEPTHINHPSAGWARFSLHNYMWLYELFRETSEEYRFRYCRTHKSWRELGDLLCQPPMNINNERPFIPPSMAMPAQFITLGDSVRSYRDYYNLGKRDLHCWSYRQPPPWITPHENQAG